MTTDEMSQEEMTAIIFSIIRDSGIMSPKIIFKEIREALPHITDEQLTTALKYVYDRSK